LPEDKIRKDFFGQEIKVGDKVAFLTPNYRDLTVGTILAFTPCKLRVSNPSYYTDATFLTTDDRVIKKP
jgi:hypothetical protein